jgi:Brp/Blh family beta-carotene 15,15'-monooxygenase
MKLLFGWHPLAPPDACRRGRLPLDQWADRGAVVFLGLGIAQVLLGLDGGWFQFVPLVLGMFLFGLPHGAIDHLVALGLAGRSMKIAPLSVVLALYLAIVVAVLALWAVLPLGAALGFLLMTIYHWGKSDVAFERFCQPATPGFRQPMADWIHLILRGLIPIGVPFVAFPEQVTAFLNACLSFYAPDSGFAAALWSPLVLLVFAVFFLADFALHLRNFHQPAARRILLENLALTLFFFCVPPLVAIGWYFAGWHGLRHVLRLCAYSANRQPSKGSLGARLSVVAWQALPFTLAAIFMLFLLLWWMAERGTSPLERTALYLILISALTLPHLIVVEWMDRREGKTSLADG